MLSCLKSLLISVSSVCYCLGAVCPSEEKIHMAMEQCFCFSGEAKKHNVLKALVSRLHCAVGTLQELKM